MRIAVISSQVFKCPPTGYAGLEMVAYHTAKGLAKRGHSVVLIAPEGSRCEGCQHIWTGPPGQWDEAKAYESYWMHLPSFECIIDNSWSKHSLRLKGEGRLPQPVLSVMHAPIDTMMKSPPPHEKPCVVCISQDQADHYQALFNRQARVCRNGIDLGFYKPMSVPRTDRFLFLARFSSIKGADIAIRACLDAGVGLDLVGDTTITNEPDYLNECLRMATLQTPGWDASKGRQITVHGGVSRGECVRWFSQAHALLHPNERFREPLGLAPLESQACGTPVLAWNYGAMRETVKHGDTGLLANSYDEFLSYVRCEWMQNVIKDDRIGCREHAKNFSVENTAARYEELCVEAVKSGGW